MSSSPDGNPPPFRDRLKETIHTYFKFGYTTFGGPAAHIAILYDDIVIRRQWISNEQFTELFAICQALPGPASTELAYSLSLVRSGFLCAIVAFLLWSLPGAIVMTVAGVLIGKIKSDIPLWATRLEQGLASAAIGLVALAAYKMSTTLATDKLTRILALVAGSVSALYSAPWLLPVMMIAGGLVSYIFDTFLQPLYIKTTERRESKSDNNEQIAGNAEAHSDQLSTVVQDMDLEQGHPDAALELANVDEPKAKNSSDSTSLRNRNRIDSTVVDMDADLNPVTSEKFEARRLLFTYSKKLGLAFFAVFLVLLIAAILVRVLVPTSTEAEYGQLVATFYFVGSIIFGGGPVIIPLLKTYTVDSGWMTDQQFLVGLALIQSLPGPNFNFACFLGAVAMVNANQSGVAGAVLCYLAIFFPGLILKNAIIPFWQFVRKHAAVKRIFRGVNACALGLVFSAMWLLWIQTNAMGGNSGYHAVIASIAFVFSGYLNIPAPLVILLGGALGAIEYAVSV
ncbi:chromate transporter [Entomortierella parvispora]|uniref:Chromate transporter n=1 Tax=Entomortierella parvispora TaxID=205924 RepID=A0A9P3LS02_9FUNG|nr:chromate transporter [Entomortierella parvispora]